MIIKRFILYNSLIALNFILFSPITATDIDREAEIQAEIARLASAIKREDRQTTIDLLCLSPHRMRFIRFLKNYDKSTIPYDFGQSIKPAVEQLGSDAKKMIRKLTESLDFEGVSLDALVRTHRSTGKIYDLDQDGEEIRRMFAINIFSDRVIVYPKPR